MTRLFTYTLILLTGAVLVLVSPTGDAGEPATATAASEPPPPRGPDASSSDRFIVLFEDSVKSVAGETEDLERAEGFESDLVYKRALEGFSAELSPSQLEDVRSDPQVASVVPDRPIRAFESLASGEPVPPPGTRRIEASSVNTTRGASRARVAVLDTGIDLDHPELNARTGRNCVDPGADADDDHGHGTHVAGTVAARNDGRGVSGVAPGTEVFSVKVLDRHGSGTTSQLLCGIDWVTGTRTDDDPHNDVAVANMSLGGTGSPVANCESTRDPQHRAICQSVDAGVMYVAAAGNEGKAFDSSSAPQVPAAYPEVLTVTAIGDSDGLPGGRHLFPTCRTAEGDDRFATFSNFATTTAGRDHLVAAPGVCIESTAEGGGTTLMSGTSMAAPHVAGVAAICVGDQRSLGPCASLSPQAIRSRVTAAATRHAADRPGYGYLGSGASAVPARSYGPLIWAGFVRPPAERPRIVSRSPQPGVRVSSRRQAVSTTFSAPMDRQRTQRAFTLISSKGSRVRGRFSWRGRTLIFRPTTELAARTTYTARFSSGATDSKGRSVSAPRSWSFRTKTRLR